MQFLISIIFFYSEKKNLKNLRKKYPCKGLFMILQRNQKLDVINKEINGVK